MSVRYPKCTGTRRAGTFKSTRGLPTSTPTLAQAHATSSSEPPSAKHDGQFFNSHKFDMRSASFESWTR